MELKVLMGKQYKASKVLMDADGDSVQGAVHGTQGISR